MELQLVTGETYDSVIVEYVLVMKLEAGLSDSEILKDFVPESKAEVQKRLDFFRREKELLNFKEV